MQLSAQLEPPKRDSRTRAAHKREIPNFNYTSRAVSATATSSEIGSVVTHSARVCLRRETTTRGSVYDACTTCTSVTEDSSDARLVLARASPGKSAIRPRTLTRIVISHPIRIAGTTSTAIVLPGIRAVACQQEVSSLNKQSAASEKLDRVSATGNKTSRRSHREMKTRKW